MNNEKRDNRNKAGKLGKIIVNVFMESKNGNKMEGIKINLYRINGFSPQLEISKLTDKNGVVIFDNLSPGNYRVIEIIDKEIYEKPIYKSWNEVNISNYLKETVIDIINRKKRS